MRLKPRGRACELVASRPPFLSFNPLSPLCSGAGTQVRTSLLASWPLLNAGSPRKQKHDGNKAPGMPNSLTLRSTRTENRENQREPDRQLRERSAENSSSKAVLGSLA